MPAAVFLRLGVSAYENESSALKGPERKFGQYFFETLI